ncbi:MAG: DNA polymerase IV, partial [Flavobacterium sp.]
ERRLKKNNLAGKTVTLKIKYSDFTLQTRSKTLPLYISSRELLMENVKDLLYQEKMKDSVRLLGISLSNLNNEDNKKEEQPPPDKTIDVQLKLDF